MHVFHSNAGGRTLACTLIWLAALAWPVAAAGQTAAGCIELEVNGERIRDYACISRLLAPTQDTSERAAPMASEQRVRQAPTTLGLAHRAATQQRMGNAFGVSTQPQRPPPPPPPPPLSRP